MKDPVVLVVGATGQLGSAIVRKLCARSMRVRALVRTGARTDHLKTLSVELVEGDLLHTDSLRAACVGVNFILATANAALPRMPKDTFQSVDRDGYRHLIDAARQEQVQHFVYASACTLPKELKIPLFAAKRDTERYLAASGLSFTIVRAASFMDLAFAMMGSDVPLRGAVAPTAERPFWFTKRFFDSVRGDLDRGRLSVIGNGAQKHSFVAIDDVAEFMVRCLSEPSARNSTIEVGGPDPLTPREVAAIYEKMTGRRLSVRTTPAAVFRIMSVLLAPFSAAAANIMAINWLLAAENGVIPGAAETAARFGIELTSAESFLSSKLAYGGKESGQR